MGAGAQRAKLDTVIPANSPAPSAHEEFAQKQEKASSLV
jgi:hypothetical protein